MSFFDNAIADILQHIALPLEFLAFVLTYIEVIYPKRADKIEAAIDRYAEFNSNAIRKLLEGTNNNIVQYIGYMLLAFCLIFITFGSFLKQVGLESAVQSAPNELPVVDIPTVLNRFEPRDPSVSVLAYWMSHVPDVLILLMTLLVVIVLYMLTTGPFFLAFVFMFIAFVAALFAKTLSALLTFLDRKSNGHALGGLGLILAIVGVIFEAYQVATLYLG